MKALLTILSGSVLLGACASATAPPPVAAGPPPEFSPAEFAWAQASGDASIRGSALYSPGNRVWTCTADGATLIPDAPYARWRVERLYRDVERGRATVADVRAREPDTPAEYATVVRTAACDTYNRFRFDGLAPGTWYVTVTMRPPSGAAGEAVRLMRRVELSAGESEAVTVGWNL